jgi:branched-chain amino acid transport system substrate-binding protein
LFLLFLKVIADFIKSLGGVNMRKKLTKIMSLLVGMVLGTTLLAGCGNSATQADSKEILIGGNFEMTGAIANFGTQTTNGIKLAFKQINDAGGINGKKLKFIIADNKSEPSESANATTKLITNDKVKVVIGAVSSSNVLAAVPIAQANKIPLITPTGTNPKITVGEDGKVNSYVFRSCFIDTFQGTIMSNFAINSLNAKTVVVYSDSSSDESKGLAEVFTKHFEAAGGKVIGQEAFLQKDQDFKATLTKIKALNPDFVFLPAYYEEVGKILKQARELGIKAKFLGTDGWDDPKMVDLAGKDAVEGNFFCNHYSAQDTDPNVKNFVDAYKAEYNQEPSALAVLGYDGALMVADAIKRAGSDDPEKIRKALEETKNFQVSTGIISLDDSHNPIKSAVVIEMKDGKQVFKERINP